MDTHPNVVDPAGFRLHRLAASLARPITRGYLTLSQAHDALASATLRAQADLEPRLPGDVLKILAYTLQQACARERERREVAIHHIRREVEPLIAAGKPSRALLAEAHGINGQEGFPLTEEEVTDVVRARVYWHLKGHRHGR